MTAKQILIAARQLIANPEHWTQHVMARSASGLKASAENDPSATCFCPMGAVIRTVGFNSKIDEPFRHLRKFFEGSISKFNDSHTHAEVLAKFDEAIQSLP